VYVNAHIDFLAALLMEVSKLAASVVLQAKLNICVAYGSSKDIAVYQAIGLQPDQIFIIGKVAKKHRKEAVVCYQPQSCVPCDFVIL